MSTNLIDDSFIGRRISVFTKSGARNIGEVVAVSDEFAQLTFFLDSKKPQSEGNDSSARRQMHVTVRQDCIESVGELS